jgi:hypothetical protein
MATPSTENIDAWPRQWRELVYEYGYLAVRDMRLQGKSVAEARAMLAERRRRRAKLLSA